MQLSDFDGKYFKVRRNGKFEVLGLAQEKLSKPSLGYAMSENYLRAACKNPGISCVICPEELSGYKLLQESEKGIAVCEEPQVAFAMLHNELVLNNAEYNYEQFDTKIGKDCKIHPTASVAPKNVSIGDNVTMEEFVVIREGCHIGNNVVIRAGAIIGASNYNFFADRAGNKIRLIESGETYLEDNVEIGYHALVARATFPYERTVIRENAFVCEFSEISHNCQIGRGSLIIKSHVCGRTSIGDRVRINPMATVKHCATVGKNAVISLGSVVVRNVPENAKVTGNFAMEHSKFLKHYFKKIREN